MAPDDPRDDTVRLNLDGTVGSSRPAPPPGVAVPPAAPPAATPPAATPPAGPVADAPSAPATPAAESAAPRDTAGGTAEPGTERAADDTVVVPPVPSGKTSRAADDTVVVPPVPPATTPEAPVTGAPAAGSSADGPETPAGPPPTEESGRPWWRRPAVLAPAAAVLVLGTAYAVDLLTAGDDLPRGTVVAGVEVGGLSPAAASERLTSDLAPRIAADHTLVADDVDAVLHPPAAGITLDVPATVDAAADQPLNPWTRLVSLVGDHSVDPVLTSDETALNAQVEQLAAQVDRIPTDATVAIEGIEASVVTPVDGRTVDQRAAAEAITNALVAGGDPDTPIEIPVDVTPAVVPAEVAERVLDETVTPALSAPVTVVGAQGAESVEVPVAAIAASLTFTPQDDGTLAVAVDPAALQTAMGDGFAAFGTAAQDARFEISGGGVTVVPSVDGQGVNPAELATQMLAVLDDPAPREVTATLGPVPAEFTTEQAQALGITEEVSSFTTNFTSSASGTNIRVVAAEVDGALVLPGETFSLNTHTGPRGTAQGYVPAAVISGGELSKAVGGGISQFATTMFNAVFFAGLEDVFHKPHSFYISRYPAGREATVYEGAIDLQWRNDGDTGIYVQTEWVPGSITVTLWGTKRYDIESVSSERRNLRQPAVQEKVDDGDCTPQSGSTGFDITVTRVFNDLGTGAELRRENFVTHYAAEAIIRCVAPAPPAPPAPDPAAPPAVPSPPG
ncbi:VanW family protein [Modestobacter marinus]|uniref:VanW family protein n=1 Tax=Modestobacter marinus TaxID=477641 RepID=UPI001C93E035|nr:VanW family protein [Modestobacter marinus]